MIDRFVMADDDLWTDAAADLEALAEFDESKHPRDRKGQFAETDETRTVRQERVRLALRTHKPSTAAKQRLAEEGEAHIASIVGGAPTDGQAPMDVIVARPDGLVGIEVKTLIDNGNDKITMHPDSRRRKEVWARKNKAEAHTVVIDRRKGRATYYHKPGVGAFRLGSMNRVTLAQLRELINKRSRAAAIETLS